MPILVDLHADPFEAAVSRGHSYEYDKWAAERMFAFVPAQAVVAEFIESFKDYPPRQKPSSFTVSDALSQLQTATQGR
jgi:arylsulfatase